MSVVVTDKIMRGKRCDNHKTKVAVVRVTSNVRSRVDGVHLCLECIQEISKYYDEVLKPKVIAKELESKRLEEEAIALKNAKEAEAKRLEEENANLKVGLTDNNNLSKEYANEFEELDESRKQVVETEEVKVKKKDEVPF